MALSNAGQLGRGRTQLPLSGVPLTFYKSRRILLVEDLGERMKRPLAAPRGIDGWRVCVDKGALTCGG